VLWSSATLVTSALEDIAQFDCPALPRAASRLGVPPPRAIPARVVAELDAAQAVYWQRCHRLATAQIREFHDHRGRGNVGPSAVE
jgi:hypothetical protein